MFDTKDCTDFSAFLERRLELASDERLEKGSWAGAGNTLGSIGLRVGLLDLDQIDQIIARQSNDSRLFGEIAVEAKFLTPEQVSGLLLLQHFHLCLDASAPLVVEERVTISELLSLMAEYFEVAEKTP